jgi:hypothetical protein
MSSNTESREQAAAPNVSTPAVQDPAVSHSQHEEFAQGFGRVETEVRAVSTSRLLRVNLHVPSTVTTVLGACPELEEHRAELSLLSHFDVRCLNKLRDYAMALAYAHSLSQAESEQQDEVGALAEQLSGQRDLLLSDAQALVARGVLARAAVERLRTGPSYKSIAFDVAGLVELFRQNWSAIAGRCMVQQSELDHAARAAQQLASALGVREQGQTSGSEGTLLRQQAFTLCVEAYDEVRRALAYLRWHAGDAEKIAPSLWSGRGRKRAPESELAPSAPASSAPASGAPESASNDSNPVPVGFPGSSPLVRS